MGRSLLKLSSTVLLTVLVAWSVASGQAAAVLHRITDPVSPRLAQYWLSATTPTDPSGTQFIQDEGNSCFTNIRRC